MLRAYLGGPMRRPALGHIIGYTALTVILTAGAAQSLAGTNTVDSGDIVDGTISTPDLKNGAVSGSKILDNSVTSADIQDLQWHTIPEYSVSGNPTPPRYAKDVQGVVHLDGLGTGTTDLGTLPLGFRPTRDVEFAAARPGVVGNIGEVIVQTSGGVIGTTDGLDLAPVSFYAG